MSSERNMTEAESIQLITSMINKAKNRFSETGMLYIVLGMANIYFAALFSLRHYIFSKIRMLIIFGMLTWLAPIYQIIYLEKVKKKKAGENIYG